VTITLQKSDIEKQRVFVLETSEKTEIGALIASYCPSLANWIREAEAPLRRVKQITNEDRLRLHNHLINCRRALVDSNTLKRERLFEKYIEEIECKEIRKVNL
jgi:hypothetical protein